MGKNKRVQFECCDTRTNETVLLDSLEEVLTYKWLLKALEMGVIKSFEYQPITFELTKQVKYNDGKKERVLFRPHVYSPDFLIKINPQYEILKKVFKVLFDNKIYVDVKGTFTKTQRSFSIDQKFVYEKYGYYIYKLIPKEFMKKCGILEEFLYTQKTKKKSKVFEGYPLITDIFKTKD